MAKKKNLHSMFDDGDHGSNLYIKPSSKNDTYIRCYEKHKPLILGSTGLQIHGGSCIQPTILDADVYIGFDMGMTRTKRQFPWEAGDEFLYKIQDMTAPSDPASFRKLVDWTLKQLQDGRKVHCGCIGGHGRTGTFLAALTCVACGEDDAVTYVRENYCSKAVETHTQLEFLHKEFGIKKANPSKVLHEGTSNFNPSKISFDGWASPSKSSGGSHSTTLSNTTIDPMRGADSLWPC